MYDTRTPIESTVVKFGVASYAIILIERQICRSGS
jgi:hypothetical protein